MLPTSFITMSRHLLQFVGSAEVRRNFIRRFDEYDGPIGLKTHDLSITTCADFSFAHMLHLDGGMRKNGINYAIWVRSTVCCRRSGGKWLITHGHISMPGTWPVPGPAENSAD